MAMCKCFSVFIGRKNANKVEEEASKGDLKSLHVKIERPGISSETDELKASTFDVTAPRGISKNSRCNVRVMNLESPVKDEAEEAYEGEDEHEDSTSIKRELSDMDLQRHANEADASKGRFDPRDDEISFPILYGIEANNQFEDKNDKESHKSIDMIQSGHFSDPGVGKAVFWASPNLKRSCSDLERRDVFRNMTRQLPYCTSQSYEDLQGLSEKQMDYLDSPKSVVTHYSADRVMLKKHSSSQVLPSRSRRLWWKLFLWSHRNIHRPWISKSTHLFPDNAAAAASNRQCGYSSDILEPQQGKAVENVELPESYTGEPFGKLSIEEHADNQKRGRFHIGESSMWPQNQWVAFSTESSPFRRVDEWVKDLETQEPLPVDGDEDNGRGIVYPTSPDIGRSMARSTARHSGANLSKEILYANSIVQSLNPASSAAHITGVGLKAIPAISHFSSLRSVNLSNNFIVHITPGLLPKGLHTLNLSRNKISTIEGLRELTRLRVLDLSYNRISRIGQGLSNCTLIKELYLAGNKISDFEGLHRLLKLNVLDMSFNKITTTKSLGQLVANFNSLQALNLLGNPIQSNISEEQLRKAVCGLLPKLVYLNKQSIKPQRAREILTDSVAKAALGNSSRSSRRRALKSGGQGGSLSSSRSTASVVQRNRNKSRSRTPK